MSVATPVIRAVAIDDEPIALRVIEAHVLKIPFLELALSTCSSLEGLLYAQQHAVDVIFLDIQMPDLNGIQFMQLLNEKSKVILTTAYAQYALQGYEYDVVDYLMKPVSFDRFLRSVQKVQRILQAASSAPDDQVVIPASEINTSGVIFIKTEHKLIKVNHDDLLYMQGGKDYTTVYTHPGKLLSLTSLTRFEESLPKTQFIRVHKSYLVALNKIQSVERQRIFLGNAVIPIGDAYKENVMHQLGF